VPACKLRGSRGGGTGETGVVAVAALCVETDVTLAAGIVDSTMASASSVSEGTKSSWRTFLRRITAKLIATTKHAKTPSATADN